jgi:hypothetical protein
MYSRIVMMQLLLQNMVHKKGVIRPLEPEVYIPSECNLNCGLTLILNGSTMMCAVMTLFFGLCQALEILESSGIKLMERVET